MVLIQDYHFALLPALDQGASARTRASAIFWHIPWPNFEAFGICPWQSEILLGMLGADLIGFHTQYYCNNFLETVDRTIEARTDWERFAVTRGEHTTYVKPFPISVAPEFVDDPPRDVPRRAPAASWASRRSCSAWASSASTTPRGCRSGSARSRASSRRYPEYRERARLRAARGAQPRARIDRYQEIQREVEDRCARSTRRSRRRRWRPIVYLKRHHEHRDIWPYYRHADFCMVTSLHDGMNLVAKEFVSVRDDEDGALILSRFTGASHELRDALIVNPYDLAEHGRGGPRRPRDAAGRAARADDPDASARSSITTSIGGRGSC